MAKRSSTLENMVNNDLAFWSGKRVLITGHTGFKGTWLMIWLKQLGAEIFGYSLEPEDDSNLFKSIVTSPSFPFNEVVNQIGDMRTQLI